ncbi:MAG: histidine phosphatase family protein [Romboutsia sp.]|nr:histidine phosphatase family protein [Romboutsia sp.]
MAGNLFLVRHGETHLNRQGVIQGGGVDVPLNSTGLKQVQELAEKLKFEHFDVCFCSPLERARTTAMQILKYHPNTKIIYDSRLVELKLGDLDGELVISSQTLCTYETQEALDRFNVESLSDFYTRVKSVIDEIIDKYKDKNVLIVSHSGTTRMAKFYLDPPDKPINEAYYTTVIDNASYLKYPNQKPLLEPKIVYRSSGVMYNKSNYSKGELKMKKVFYPGVFDVLHTGHILAIEEAKKHCDYLIVGLHCCPNYKEPVQTIYERYMQLRACKYVDEVIPYYDLNDCKNIIQSLDFDVYFLGEDHKGMRWENDTVVEEAGKEIYYLSRKHIFSSTYVKDRVVGRYIEDNE